MKLLPQIKELPLCCVCNKPVNSIVVAYDVADETIQIKALCHGKEEHVKEIKIVEPVFKAKINKE